MILYLSGMKAIILCSAVSECVILVKGVKVGKDTEAIQQWSTLVSKECLNPFYKSKRMKRQ